MNEIIIEVPEFVRKIKVSEKQRAKYFEWNGITIKGKGKNLPMSFYKDKQYVKLNTNIEDLKDNFFIGIFNKNGKCIVTIKDNTLLPNLKEIVSDKCRDNKYRLCTIIDNEIKPVILNSKVVNTPKWYLIKGQDIYSGVINEHLRGHVMDSIKQCYLPFVKDLPIITDYPIKITCKLYDTIKNEYDKSTGLGQRWDVDNFVYPYLKAFPDLLVSLGKLQDDDRLHIPGSIGVDFIPIKYHKDRKLVFTITSDKRPELEEIINFHVTKNKNTYETEDLDLIKEEIIWLDKHKEIIDPKDFKTYNKKEKLTLEELLKRYDLTEEEIIKIKNKQNESI